MSQLHFFLGANTPIGFVSFYDEITSQSDTYRSFVIKGGPGGEEQCVCGGKQAAVPKGMQPGEVYIYGPKGSNVYLQKDGTIELTGRISIRGQFLVNGEPYKPCTCGGGL